MTEREKQETTPRKGFSETEGIRGSVYISESVIATLAAYAAWKTNVIQPAKGGLAGTLVDVFGAQHSRGIEVTLAENGVRFVLHVALKLEKEPIHILAKQLQEAIIDEVESMTSLRVERVDVSVEAVELQRAESRTPSAEPDLAERMVNLVNASNDGVRLAQLADALDMDWHRLTGVAKDLVESGRIEKRGRQYFPPNTA